MRGLAIRALFSALVVMLSVPGGSVLAIAPPVRKPNVLFIAVDDLRPLLGCYGHREMVTPSLDKFAREGRLFEHHYAQVPTCGASRCALLTGRYPSSAVAYDNGAFESIPRKKSLAPVSLPQLFQQNGYRTECIGKISHSPDGKRPDGQPELPFGWDATSVPHGQWQDAWAAFFAYTGGKTRIVRQTPVSERADVPDNGYPDGLIADAAIDRLHELKDRPFFLAVGFFKPHLPFNAPTRYWRLYDKAQLEPPTNSKPPLEVDAELTLGHSGEMLSQYTGFSQRGVVSDAEGRHLRQAYRACVSYVDAQIGRLLAELDRLGLRENSIVVIWGDHGWQLGEHGVWGKHTLYEDSMRSVLMVRTPQVREPGEPAVGMVESVDIYPTLAELCFLAPPAGLSGRSFVPMLRDALAPGKEAVYGFWRNGRAHSIRTDRYRLVLWKAEPASGRVVQKELYDLENDPGETKNIAAENRAVVERLTSELCQAAPLLEGP
jgi:arylsulfatase A-like enzyme